jgi:hypothetical protein
MNLEVHPGPSKVAADGGPHTNMRYKNKLSKKYTKLIPSCLDPFIIQPRSSGFHSSPRVHMFQRLAITDNSVPPTSCRNNSFTSIYIKYSCDLSIEFYLVSACIYGVEALQMPHLLIAGDIMLSRHWLFNLNLTTQSYSNGMFRKKAAASRKPETLGCRHLGSG